MACEHRPGIGATVRDEAARGHRALLHPRDLDEGPIIEQAVARVSHRESVRELTRGGADLERVALARAVAWRCNDRVLLHDNTTIVF